MMNSRAQLLLSIGLLFVLAGCAEPPATPFTITIENAGTEAVFFTTWTDQPIVTLEQRIDGEWEDILMDGSCWAKCGQLGPVACADIAFMEVVYALVAGDSADIEFNGVGLFVQRNNLGSDCVKERTIIGPIRATVCHGTTAETWAGDPITAPIESGVVNLNDGGFAVSPVCESIEFTLPDELGGTFVLGL